MSSSLYWAPLPSYPEEKNIGFLKFILKDRLNLDEQAAEVDKSLIPYLEGIISGSSDKDVIKDAQKLIAAIKKHDKVKLSLHY